jgi:hypothetical protein
MLLLFNSIGMSYLKSLCTLSVSVLLLLQAFGSSGISEQAMAEKQQQKRDLVITTVFRPVSFPSSQINGTFMPPTSNNSSLYENSTYGIKFQFPYGWNKIELLTGRLTNIEFTSPTGNVTGGTQLPAEVVISIEKGLRVSPTNQRDEERLMQLKLREEEQDRIIRIIKGIKK